MSWEKIYFDQLGLAKENKFKALLHTESLVQNFLFRNCSGPVLREQTTGMTGRHAPIFKRDFVYD